MGIADWLREVPFVDDFVELVELAAELVPDGEDAVSRGDYAELREGMYWTTGEDGVTTRERLLAETSLEPVERDGEGRIVSGLWKDAHTGYGSADPADFDIDHRVPFAEIVDQFPQVNELPREEQLAIYNDSDNLQVTHDAHNRAKGAASPAEHAWAFTDPKARTKFLRDCADYVVRLRSRFG